MVNKHTVSFVSEFFLLRQLLLLQTTLCLLCLFLVAQGLPLLLELQILNFCCHVVTLFCGLNSHVI